LKQIKVIIKPYLVSKVIKDLKEHVNFTDVIVSSVGIFGKPGDMKTNIKIYHEYYGYSKRVKLEFFIADDSLDHVIDIINDSVDSGNPDDGKIFVSSVDEVLKIHLGKVT